MILSELAAQPTILIAPDETVLEAARRMSATKARVSVVIEAGKLVGVLDEQHPDRQAARYGHDPRETRVMDLMTRGAICCSEDQECAAALSLMQEHHLNHVPVVDHHRRIVGVVSREDIHQAVF